MKKMYVKPSMEVVEFYSNVVMRVGSLNVNVGGGDNAGDDEIVEAGSNDRRGGWGSLWD